MSIALFNTGICVFSEACNNVAQSSADNAQTGISNFVSLSSSAVMRECLICGLIVFNSENALLYSPLESIITNFAPLAE